MIILCTLHEVLLLSVTDPGSVAFFAPWMRDPGWEKIWIRDKHPGFASLVPLLILISEPNRYLRTVYRQEKVFFCIFFWRAGVCRPLLCLCRPFMIFEIFNGSWIVNTMTSFVKDWRDITRWAFWASMHQNGTSGKLVLIGYSKYGTEHTLTLDATGKVLITCPHSFYPPVLEILFELSQWFGIG